ncbi:hypothetical protein ACHAW5_000538 [Stephanodiscus triporus]|uniref:SP-RING-type domain-containing protein n=1 Tax=Stephanodiscus triporus TaxID=2934178 RepID=A0ABD3MMJ2_9STRA
MSDVNTAYRLKMSQSTNASAIAVIPASTNVVPCASNQNGKRGPRGGIYDPFPIKFHRALDQIRDEGMDSIVSWVSHGRAFKIHKPKVFAATIMPRFFNQSKYTSFQRQLNLYGDEDHRDDDGDDRGIVDGGEAADEGDDAGNAPPGAGRPPNPRDDMIDLTADSPPPPPSADDDNDGVDRPAETGANDDVAGVASGLGVNVVKADDAGVPSGRGGDEVVDAIATLARPPPPSPPPSPPPRATIRNLPPSPGPSPRPFADVRTQAFRADAAPIASGSLTSRPGCVVAFDAGFHLDGSGTCMDGARCVDVGERLRTWEPYWRIVEELGSREVRAEVFDPSCCEMARVGTRTTSCVLAGERFSSITNRPNSCATMFIDLPKEIARSESSGRDSSGKSLPQGYRPWGVRWGKKLTQPGLLQTGDRRLILRTLPLQRSTKEKKKRADCHLWPKGTFIELSYGGSGKVAKIIQRRQQSHDPSEWKGSSYPLDLTEDVASTNVPIEIKLCSYEVVENSETEDDAVKGTLTGSFALHVAICEYVSPDALYDQLMGKVVGSDVIIPRMSLRSARKLAKDYLADQTVSIIDSDDEDDNARIDTGDKPSGDKHLNFSLLCPISMTAMETPVRARQCKHLQCFDLRNFLHANKSVTGGRWRCGVSR